MGSRADFLAEGRNRLAGEEVEVVGGEHNRVKVSRGDLRDQEEGTRRG